MSDYGWLILENIVIIIVAGILAYAVSPWCMLILLGYNSLKEKNT